MDIPIVLRVGQSYAIYNQHLLRAYIFIHLLTSMDISVHNLKMDGFQKDPTSTILDINHPQPKIQDADSSPAD